MKNLKPFLAFETITVTKISLAVKESESLAGSLPSTNGYGWLKGPFAWERYRCILLTKQQKCKTVEVVLRFMPRKYIIFVKLKR